MIGNDFGKTPMGHAQVQEVASRGREKRYMQDRGGLMSTAIGIARLRLSQGDAAGAAQVLDDACDKLHRLHWDACVADGHDPDVVASVFGSRERKVERSWPPSLNRPLTTPSTPTPEGEAMPDVTDLTADDLTADDLTACPRCGTRDSHWLREVGQKAAWQPFSLTLDDDGSLLPDDYHEWDVSDETTVEQFECSHCTWSWPTLDEVRLHLVAARNAHADFDAGWSPNTVKSYAHVAGKLFAIVTDPRLRLELEGSDLLAEARAALGLAATTTVHVTAPDRVNIVWHHQSAEWEER